MALPSKQSIGFFPGVWDLFHVGHLRALKEAKTLCSYLVVGLNKDPTEGNPSKNVPIIPWEHRLEILQNISCIDKVIVYENDKELFEMDQIQGLWDIRFMGWEYKDKEHQPIKASVVYVKGDQRYHTSGIRKQIYETESIINGK